MSLLHATVEALMGFQTEAVIFLVAMCIHAVVFGQYRIKPSTAKSKRLQSPRQGNCQGEHATAAQSSLIWSLVKSAKHMLRDGADPETITHVLDKHLQTGPPAKVNEALEGMLDIFGKAATGELLRAVRDLLHQRDMQPSSRLAEMLLRSYLGKRLQTEFNEVLAEIEAKDTITSSVAILALRAAVNASDLESALLRLRKAAGAFRASTNTASGAPQYILQQLSHLAAQKSALPKLLHELVESNLLSANAVEAVLSECVQQGDVATLAAVEKTVRDQGVGLTGKTFGLLIKGVGKGEDALRLFHEGARQEPTSKDLFLAATDIAIAHKDDALASAILKYIPANPAPELAAAMIRLSAEGQLAGDTRDSRVLDLFEKRFHGIDILADAQAGRLVAEAALRCKRPDLLARLMEASPEGPRPVALLKSFGSERRLGDAQSVFKAIPKKTSCLYNALLDACIDCQDMESTERVLAEATAANLADVVTYNTIMKSFLQTGDFKRAHATLNKMQAAGGGLAPDCVTFNELIDATIRTNRAGAWRIIDEMKTSGIQPNSVTCSILLKTIQQNSQKPDVDRTMAVVDSLNVPMDEVLLSSLCEACIRVGRSDFLRRILNRQNGIHSVSIKGAHTFGSLIRAYSFLRDVQGAWNTWREMRSRHIAPTSITIGCMVEALVSNGDPDAGYELIHEMLKDRQTRPLVNAVIYCSVLKGFCHQKRFNRVWDVHRELLAERLQFSIVTFNALIDACARSGEMARVGPLLEDMASQKIEPNIVTYSTIIKGYCQENRLEKAFELLEHMKRSVVFKPDEITYNTLIDGCARHCLFDRGIALLDEMQKVGVPPTNFTLSVVVKLANRCKKMDKAFELCEQICRKYNLQLNVHVYDNLVHVCTSQNDIKRALDVLVQMVHEKVRPDARTYSLLLKCCVGTQDFKGAAGLLRAAFGVPGAHPKLVGMEGAALQPRGGLPSEVVLETLESMAGPGGDTMLATQLRKEWKSLSGLGMERRP